LNEHFTRIFAKSYQSSVPFNLFQIIYDNGCATVRRGDACIARVRRVVSCGETSIGGSFLKETAPTPSQRTLCRPNAAINRHWDKKGSRGEPTSSGGPARNPSTAGRQPPRALRVRAGPAPAHVPEKESHTDSPKNIEDRYPHTFPTPAGGIEGGGTGGTNT